MNPMMPPANGTHTDAPDKEQLRRDRQKANKRRCPLCGRVGMDFIPFREGGEYAPLAVCENPRCGHRERFSPTPPGPASGGTVTDDSPKLITAKEVACLLSISVRTVWRLLERLELPPPVRFNRKLVRWSRESVEKYIDELSRTQATY